MAFAGFDTSAFPGLAAMAWLKAHTNLAWTGFYLAPAPSHADAGWMAHRAELAAQGWGFAPVYVGQELAGPGAHQVSAEQGKVDGADAAQLMATAGFRPGSVCFLDLEDGAPWAEPRIGYVTAWALALQGPTVAGRPSGYHVGVYCSHALAQPVRDALEDTGVVDAEIWVFKVATTQRHPVSGTAFSQSDASGGGVAWAQFWQHDQNAVIDCNGHPMLVDLSTSLWRDPSDSTPPAAA